MMLAGKCQKSRVLKTHHFFSQLGKATQCLAMRCAVGEWGIRIRRKFCGVTYRKVVGSVGQG